MVLQVHLCREALSAHCTVERKPCFIPASFVFIGFISKYNLPFTLVVVKCLLPGVGFSTFSALKLCFLAYVVVLHHVSLPVAVGDELVAEIAPLLLGTGGQYSRDLWLHSLLAQLPAEEF